MNLSPLLSTTEFMDAFVQSRHLPRRLNNSSGMEMPAPTDSVCFQGQKNWPCLDKDRYPSIFYRDVTGDGSTNLLKSLKELFHPDTKPKKDQSIKLLLLCSNCRTVTIPVAISMGLKRPLAIIEGNSGVTLEKQVAKALLQHKEAPVIAITGQWSPESLAHILKSPELPDDRGGKVSLKGVDFIIPMAPEAFGLSPNIQEPMNEEHLKRQKAAAQKTFANGLDKEFNSITRQLTHILLQQEIENHA